MSIIKIKIACSGMDESATTEHAFRKFSFTAVNDRGEGVQAQDKMGSLNIRDDHPAFNQITPGDTYVMEISHDV